MGELESDIRAEGSSSARRRADTHYKTRRGLGKPAKIYIVRVSDRSKFKTTEPPEAARANMTRYCLGGIIASFYAA